MTQQHNLSIAVDNFKSNFRIQLTGYGQHQHIPIGKLALVCEGGGQRGIFTAGILDSFLENDYFPFHALFGVSAGAQNLTSYVCDAFGYAREAILRYTTSKKFFDPLRFARGGHLIDLDWYFETLNKEMPLNFEDGVRRLVGRSFHICASRRDTLAADYLSFQSHNVEQSIKASSAIPLIYRRPVSLDGIDYWDGGVADSVPVQAAHASGSDCIVVIRTQPRESINPLKIFPQNWNPKRMQEMRGLVDSYVKNYNLAMDFMDTPPDEVKIIDIAPITPLKSRLLGSKKEELLDDYRMGLECGRQFLEQYAWRLSSTQSIEHHT